MDGSPSMPVSKDLNLPYPSTAPFGGHHHQQQMSSGLLRYRSAPSSLLGELCEDFLPVTTSCPETDTLLARFLAPDLQIRDNKPPGGAATGQRSPQLASPDQPPAAEGSGAFSSASQMMMLHSQHGRQQTPNHSSAECSYPMAGSMAKETEQINNNGGAASSSNLVRHSSSPDGFFSHLNAENGYPMLRRVTGFSNEGDAMGLEANRLKNQISFLSKKNSMMSQISEAIGGSSPEDSSGGQCYIPAFPATSWNNSSLFSGNNNFSGPKTGTEGGRKITDGLNPSDHHQNGEVMRKHVVSGLTHQFSLPNTSSEIEKYLQFQDAVPCKIRAKRGCATHPRSIAERERRTRISERIRKLQEIVPNMDKQTNTADMLDLAISYIKDLQKQVKTLSENRATCTCSSGKQKQYLNPSA